MPLPKKKVIQFVAPSGPAIIPTMHMARQMLRKLGFEVHIDAQCYQQSAFFAGTHSERAEALYNALADPEIDIVWAVRGGYGAIHTLTHLKMPPVTLPKIFIGFSDTTALFPFLASRQVQVIHGPMPCMAQFTFLGKTFWRNFSHFLKSPKKFSHLSLHNTYLGRLCTTKKNIRAPLVGGNLTVLCSLLGTPLEPIFEKGSILFLEDVDEQAYKIHRMVSQLALSGFLSQFSAIVLGDFLRCQDKTPLVLKAPVKSRAELQTNLALPEKLHPLRPTLHEAEIIHAIFGAMPLPVFTGLRCGHGPNFEPLLLHTPVKLEHTGRLRFVKPEA